MASPTTTEAFLAILPRAAWYAGSLGAAGLAFFALGFGGRQTASEVARLLDWARVAAGLATLSAAAALGAQVLALADGTLLDAEVWGIVLGSAAGQAYGLGLIGLGGVVLALPRHPGVAAFAGATVCASFLLTGHTTRSEPRLVAAGLLLLHLLIAAAWIGSLPPLAWAARRGGPDAAHLLADWSSAALLAVPLLIGAGAALALLLSGGIGAIAGSAYGGVLLVKSLLVALMLALAARHRLRLVPALAAGTPGAGTRLARSVVVEVKVALLVLVAAVVLVSDRPPALP